MAESLHALLHDAGWRWEENAARRSQWRRLRPGELDPATGRAYQGPRLQLGPATTIVVDEAGMVDMATCHALTQLVQESGARLAFVGDPLQLAPVGHHGAMQLAITHATQHVELEEVHRFRTESGETDHAYAALTRRLRTVSRAADAAEAEQIAWDLVSRGQVLAAADAAEAHELMVQRWLADRAQGRSTALVVNSNEEALEVNTRLQAERLERGQLSGPAARGREDSDLYAGDLVQTRRNDTGLGVANRDLWTVREVRDTGLLLESAAVPGQLRTVPHDYVTEHVQLAYATTAHGVQGETVHGSLVGPGVDAAGLYVGLTRGRRRNEVIVVSDDEERLVVQQLVSQLGTGQIEATLEQNAAGAAQELAAAARGGAGRTAPWQQRPAGHLHDLDAAIAEERGKLRTPEQQMRQMRDELERQEAQLRTQEMQRATRNAHARPGEDDHAPAGPAERQLREQAAELRAEIRRRDRTDRRTWERIDVLEAERAIREQVLSPAEAAREEYERRFSTSRPARPPQMAPTDSSVNPHHNQPIGPHDPGAAGGLSM